MKTCENCEDRHEGCHTGCIHYVASRLADETDPILAEIDKETKLRLTLSHHPKAKHYKDINVWKRKPRPR